MGLLPGFNMLRNDRKYRRSGKVAVYVRNGLVGNVIESASLGDIEYLAVELVFRPLKAVDFVDTSRLILTTLLLSMIFLIDLFVTT